VDTPDNLAAHVAVSAGIDLVRFYRRPQPEICIIDCSEVLGRDLRLLSMPENFSAVEVETSRILIGPGAQKRAYFADLGKFRPSLVVHAGATENMHVHTTGTVMARQSQTIIVVVTTPMFDTRIKNIDFH
jgi:hypothetical protein